MFFFKENKDRSDLRAFVRRVTDLTSPNLPPLKGELRTLTRSNRTFPVLLTPWIRGAPNMEACVAALAAILAGAKDYQPGRIDFSEAILGWY